MVWFHSIPEPPEPVDVQLEQQKLLHQQRCARLHRLAELIVLLVMQQPELIGAHGRAACAR